VIVSDVITLLSETQAQRGVHDAPEYAERQVYCTVRSVGRNEFYQALALGIQTEIRFILDQSFEYQGERRLLYHDQPYEIIRTYVTEADGIELTARKAVDE
jgi:head-tail adaptor